MKRYVFTAEIDFEIIADSQEDAMKIADSKLANVPMPITSVVFEEVGRI